MNVINKKDVIARSDSDAAIQHQMSQSGDGLLRFARNDKGRDSNVRAQE